MLQNFLWQAFPSLFVGPHEQYVHLKSFKKEEAGIPTLLSRVSYIQGGKLVLLRFNDTQNKTFNHKINNPNILFDLIISLQQFSTFK